MCNLVRIVIDSIVFQGYLVILESYSNDVLGDNDS